MSMRRGGNEIPNKTLDRQIDEAVYELYGLTEEEIKIVESTCVRGNRTFAK